MDFPDVAVEGAATGRDHCQVLHRGRLRRREEQRTRLRLSRRTVTSECIRPTHHILRAGDQCSMRPSQWQEITGCDLRGGLIAKCLARRLYSAWVPGSIPVRPHLVELLVTPTLT